MEQLKLEFLIQIDLRWNRTICEFYNPLNLDAENFQAQFSFHMFIMHLSINQI